MQDSTFISSESLAAALDTIDHNTLITRNVTLVVMKIKKIRRQNKQTLKHFYFYDEGSDPGFPLLHTPE